LKQQQLLVIFSLSLVVSAVDGIAAPVTCKAIIREVDHLSSIKLVESAGLAKECLVDLPGGRIAGPVSAGDAIEFVVPDKPAEISGIKVTRFRMPVNARIDSIDVENGRVRIRQPGHVRATDKDRLSRLFPEDGGIIFAGTAMRQTQAFKKLAEGDRIRVTIGVTPADRATAEIDDVRPLRVSDIGGCFPPWMFLAAAVLLVGFLAAIASTFSPLKMFFVGQDGEASKSKTQMSFWLMLVLSVLLATVFCRACFGLGFTGSVAMPVNLALLAGISGITFVSAKAIRVQKEKTAPSGTTQTPKLSNLVTEDKSDKLSLGAFQMLMVVAVAIIIYVLQVHEFLAGMELTMSITLPDIDGSIATLFGVSQGAYVGNKAAS